MPEGETPAGSENPTAGILKRGSSSEAPADEQEDKPPGMAAEAGEADRSGSTGRANRERPEDGETAGRGTENCGIPARLGTRPSMAVGRKARDGLTTGSEERDTSRPLGAG